MKNIFIRIIVSAVLFLLVFAGRTMDEGMWLLDSVGKLPLAQYKSNGYQLTAEQIFSTNGPSLKDAIVLLGGGTASFVSAEGLMVTNHHVAFGGIQQLSSVQDDYLKNGFWAKTRNEELSTTYTAQILMDMKDVTGEILSVVTEGMTPDARRKAVADKIVEVEKAAKGTSDLTCRVSEMFSGVKYYLFTHQVLNDVRLVYAPPSAIGNFGGENDNWIWPRHTGDFSLMRAYIGKDGKPAKYAKDNVPFTPKKFLPISAAGYTDGSFAMIMGYPARTMRYRESAGVMLDRDATLPLTAKLYHARMEIMENAWKNDRGLQIKLASRWRGLANTYKNALGKIEGMERADLVTLKKKVEREFAEYVKSTPALTRKYGTILSDFDRLTGELRGMTLKNTVLTNLNAGVDMLRVAGRLRRNVTPREAEAAPPVMPSREPRSITEFIPTVYRTYDAQVDKQTLVMLMLKSFDLPAEQQFDVFRQIVGDATGGERERKVKVFVDGLYADSLLASQAGALKLAALDSAQVMRNPCVKFSGTISAETRGMEARIRSTATELNALRITYIEGLVAWKHSALLYPDANRTLRLSYGTIRGFSPRDAVSYNWLTTLSGVMEKETGEEPFIVLSKLKELWQKKDFGRYADKKTGDIPVAFASDLDITGGNSGSPVINGKGELIGCAFDGNWEGLVGDYYFDERLNRTISVDMRYMLFVLDKFSGAENILKEMTIK